MTTYAVGDIHGCYDALARGLDMINFDPAKDRLWCTGDLVNRGGQSPDVLALLYPLRSRLQVVLGNHDLYLLYCMYGKDPAAANVEMRRVMAHPDAGKWCSWLRQCPLYHYSPKRNLYMAHAGIPHIWPLHQAMQYGDEVSTTLRCAREDDDRFWQGLFGKGPKKLKKHHDQRQRLRVIVNYFTRMRFIDSSGKMDLKRKDTPNRTSDSAKQAWYAFARDDHPELQILFGHWAALKGRLPGKKAVQAIPLDTGCVWGGHLTFRNLKSGKTLTTTQKT